jgi:predicted DNA-binding WGR domain protein
MGKKPTQKALIEKWLRIALRGRSSMRNVAMTELMRCLNAASQKRVKTYVEKKAAESDNPRRKDEAKHWNSLQDKLADIQACCMDVISGEATGFYLYGRGGTSKTWTVLEMFREHCPNQYVYHKGGLTPGGFFDLLEENSITQANRHLILDDVYEVMKSDRDRQYFLSALDHTDNMVRRISYKRQGQQGQNVHADFGKGIVLISNADFAQHNKDVMKAIDDRVDTLEHSPSDGEMWSLIYYIADHPETLPTAVLKTINKPRQKLHQDCLKIADILYDEMVALKIRPTLRWYVDKAVKMYYSKGSKIKNWRDRLRSLLARHSVESIHGKSTADRTGEYLQIAVRIEKEGGKLTVKVEKWNKETASPAKPQGLGQSYFYKKIAEAREEGLLPPK